MERRRTHDPESDLHSCGALSPFGVASEYHGQVTFAGLPVPGVTITATQGSKTFSTVTDQGGVYNFADLADGVWKIEIQMQCFSTIQSEVTVPGCLRESGN